MSQFIKNVFASCLGVALALFVFFFVGIFFITALAGSGGKKTVSVSENSVLHLRFDHQVPEQTNNVESSGLEAFKGDDVLGLNDVLKLLEHAAADDNIKGVYINPEADLGMGLATADAYRKALEKFKESDKYIISNSKYYSQGAYYLASVADQVYINPLGSVDFHGFSAMIPFFKDMLDKIGVKMEVFYAGDFKSGSEPFRLNKMTDNNRLQMREFLEPVYQNFLADIGKSRKMDVAALRAIADGLKVRTAADALSLGLVDKVGYVDEVISDFKQRFGLKDTDKINVITLEDYAMGVTLKKDFKTKERIALVYAEGDILMNEGPRGSIVDQKYVKMLREIREDEKIKAVVLRVNSGGGSAIASENIWRELELIKKAGKKIVVSMGDYAASGGYYIACNADKIIAEPNTLTGSIGVFSMMPNASKMFDEKLGIHWDTVKTTKYSTGVNPFYDVTPLEAEQLQYSTQAIYEIFLQRVADGRDMARDSVHNIAQGRVWIAEKAIKIGLVDEVGGIELALSTAAELAGLEKYRLMEYPRQPDPMQELIAELTGEGGDKGIRGKAVEEELNEIYPNYKTLKKWVKMEGVQARLPFIIPFK